MTDHDITVLQSELRELRGANQSLYERYREAADLAAVRGVELREAKELLARWRESATQWHPMSKETDAFLKS